jgi:hypothetical protein
MKHKIYRGKHHTTPCKLPIAVQYITNKSLAPPKDAIKLAKKEISRNIIILPQMRETR